MRFLIDTHCWLWAISQPGSMRSEAVELLRSPENDVVFSAVSSLEIAIKVALGKLRLPEPPETFVPSRLAELHMSSLPLYHVHALRLATLPPHHKDPFDRLLVAQGQVENLPILTADERLAAYDVEIIWAGRRQPKKRRLRQR